MIKNCKCGTRIIFLKTINGKNIPVEWNGYIEPGTVFNPGVMTSHFAKCSLADKYRKKDNYIGNPIGGNKGDL